MGRDGAGSLGRDADDLDRAMATPDDIKTLIRGISCRADRERGRLMILGRIIRDARREVVFATMSPGARRPPEADK